LGAWPWADVGKKEGSATLTAWAHWELAWKRFARVGCMAGQRKRGGSGWESDVWRLARGTGDKGIGVAVQHWGAARGCSGAFQRDP